MQSEMMSERFYHACYRGLTRLHWIAFFAVVETMFWFAGLILFGLLGTFFSWIWFLLSEQNARQELLPVFVTTGKYCGLLIGVFFTRYVAGRSARSAGRR